MQQYQKAGKPTGKVGQSGFGLTFCFEGSDAKISFGRNTARLPHERCADDFVRVGVFVAGSGSSPANVNFPLVDEVRTRRHFASGDVSRAAILIDYNISVTLFGLSPKVGPKTEWSERANQLVKTFVFRQ